MVPRCWQRENLFKAYGVNNINDLATVINRPLLDSLKVTTFRQLQDTLRKINRKKIELAYANKNINTSRLGWVNVDCFSGYGRAGLTRVNVDLEPGRNIVCRLVFKRLRAIIAASPQNGEYVFEGGPKGETAVVVAIKYEEGRPLLATKEISVSERFGELAFKRLAVEDLRAELRKLD